MKVIILVLAIIIVLPIFLLPADKTFSPLSDWDSNLPIYDFFVDFVRTYHRFPQYNPYVSTGIPVIADPLSAILNPFFIFPLLIFGVDWGMKVVIFLVYLFSGFSAFWFLGKLKVKSPLRLFGVLLYQTAGSLAARIAAGHIEKFLSYPLFPLFLGFALKEKIKLKEDLILGLIFTLIVFSGDFYSFYFLMIFFVLIRGYYFWQNKNWRIVKEFLLVFLVFSLTASPKLIPFIFQVYPNLERFFPIQPQQGSIHLFLTPLPFMIPWQEKFYDRPTLQRFFGFHFNWYEYFAFISPLPFIFLFKVSQVLKEKKIKALLIILGGGLLYASLKYPYSPFYWLIKFFPLMGTFRVPQRIFLPLTAVVIALLIKAADWWLGEIKKKKGKVFILGILFLSVFLSGITTERILLKTFVAEEKENQQLIKDLRKKDESNFYVVVFSPGMQRFLIKEKIPILNYYYGWRPKNAPNFLDKKGEKYNYSMLEKIRPKYVIGPKNLDFSFYSYQFFIGNNQIGVWKTEDFNCQPKVVTNSLLFSFF